MIACRCGGMKMVLAKRLVLLVLLPCVDAAGDPGQEQIWLPVALALGGMLLGISSVVGTVACARRFLRRQDLPQEAPANAAKACLACNGAGCGMCKAEAAAKVAGCVACGGNGCGLCAPKAPQPPEEPCVRCGGPGCSLCGKAWGDPMGEGDIEQARTSTPCGLLTPSLCAEIPAQAVRGRHWLEHI
mmetsp:Transcript_8014/g.18663  ORF Transcript_8014/g.18663 Transcript_8014/m.18663 type:complete len:187 (-) Transcript_8014:345-905(-)